MCVIANAVAATMAAKAAREAAEHRAAQALLLELGVVLMDDPELPPTPAAPVPAPAAPTASAPPVPAMPVRPAVPTAPAPVDPVVGQQLVAAKAAVDEANKVALAAKAAEQAVLSRLGEVEAELAAVKRQALTDHAESSLRVAALETLWTEENTAKLAAQEELAALKAAAPPSGSGLLGIIPPEMVGKFEELEPFMGSEEGKAFLAAFAAGEDSAIDMVKKIVTPVVEGMVKKIPAGKIDLAGRSVDVVGGILMDALRERAEEEDVADGEQPELVPVPDPVTTPAARQHPLKKGKPRRVNRHGSLDELGDLVGTGELRVRSV